MKNLYLLFFNETTELGFPGFIRDKKIEDLPIFGKYKVKEIHEKLTFKVHKDVLKLNNFEDFLVAIRSINSGDMLILVRSSNILYVDIPLVDSLQNGVILHDSEDIIKYRMGSIPSDLYTLYGSALLDLFSNIEVEKYNSFTNLCSEFFDKILFYNFTKMVDIGGYSFLIRNISEYYSTNLLPLAHQEISGFMNVLYRNIVTANHEIKIGRNGFVKNSFLGNGSSVDGLVINSAISNDVKIEKNSRVLNSIILPGNEIEESVLIENAVILNGRGRKIGRDSIIGGSSRTRNEDYPEFIKNGLSVIGEDISVPTRSRIGSGCFLTEVAEPDKPVILGDGKSV